MSEKVYNELVEKIKSYNPNANFAIIEKAYEVAKKYHQGQTRLSGEPFLCHPIEVAKILADLELNSKTIAAGIMHDVIEDTEATYEDIMEIFGEEIADMVEGVSKLSKLNLDTRKEQQVESLRKMLMAMSKDIRVIIIKLSDRLHNMRTLSHVSREKQIEKATETIEIYAPISHRLGMSAFKWELEDLAFRYLYPEDYRNIVNQISEKRLEREKYIQEIISEISSNLSEKNIIGRIDGRAKHLYSIYNKMKRQGTSLDQIYDLFAVRIIVDSIKDCYAALGMVHEMFKPVPGRFKDYIAMPKQNMYQSLHTTVIGKMGKPFEAQIRTYEMHRVAEYGIAAHWKYKQGIKGAVDDMESKLAWIRQMVEWQKDTNDTDEFYDNLKIDLFDDEVFVFTPKGDVINLPAGSTPIDFAYAIHSAVGNKMTGAKINGKMVPISYKLENGDIVDVITTAAAKGPSRDWLKLVKSSQAKNKIRQYFKKEHKDENLEKGKELIEAELKRQGIVYSDIFKPEYYNQMLERYNFKSLEDALGAVGYSGITANKIISKLKETYRRINGEEPGKKTKPSERVKSEHVNTTSEKGVIVKGINNCLVTMARCCNPVPGDDICGFITRGRGVTVHRSDCVNVINDPSFNERGIEVMWSGDTSEEYMTEIVINAHDRKNLLSEVTNILNDSKVTLNSVEARANSDGMAYIKIQMGITDRDQLALVIKKLKRISGVTEINRTNKNTGRK
ncbi:MAG TPA: bifunctional (p)ppGpp synthetase/guanosine-3',5'-bis(diphosphate) 3'-pyrophosphohydrolase [Clostridia bacterium]|nr:bifunctional (p)ppGpp synthetase/guanosine-3',5'-bis(diphosphate) 3'-pyrophosphohydrolase [Clostridia bacterium]HRX42913.1 bifunctional (p)ppGpp synthetase/guanosine-3',5'-bis(diphosphate) 3'-pyrophosphohydrolase [Clostridia bacterium]